MFNINDQDFKALLAKIQSSDRILLCAHRKPDGDTLGATSSLLTWLIQEGKNVTAFCNDPIPGSFKFLDNIHKFTSDPTIFQNDFDLILVLDSSSLDYCGIEKYLENLNKKPFIYNIDHHPTNTNYGDVNIVIPTASSTAEIISYFYKVNKINVDHKMATSLLTGLFTDTGNFQNSATNANAIQTAGTLLQNGARLYDIQQNVNHKHNIESLKLWGRVLSRLHTDKEINMNVTYILNEDIKDAPKEATAGISNFISAMLDRDEAILVLQEMPNNTIKGSMRSKNRDVAKIAKHLGGGGHALAAGFTINGQIQETPEGIRIT